MNIIKEIEQVLQHPTFIGNDTTGCNLAANAIIDRLNELGLEIIKKNNTRKVNNLPDKFKFKSTVKGMDEIIYTAIKAENSYVITWYFLGEHKDMVMSVDTMAYYFNQNEYEFVW